MVKTSQKNPRLFLLSAAILLMGATASTPLALNAFAQTPKTEIRALLDKARALETAGKLDQASATWQEALAGDQNNAEALGGLARVAAVKGNYPLASIYHDRIDQIHAVKPVGIDAAQTKSALRPQENLGDPKLTDSVSLNDVTNLVSAPHYVLTVAPVVLPKPIVRALSDLPTHSQTAANPLAASKTPNPSPKRTVTLNPLKLKTPPTQAKEEVFGAFVPYHGSIHPKPSEPTHESAPPPHLPASPPTQAKEVPSIPIAKENKRVTGSQAPQRRPGTVPPSETQGESKPPTEDYTTNPLDSVR